MTHVSSKTEQLIEKKSLQKSAYRNNCIEIQSVFNSHLLLLQPLGQISGRVAAAQRGSKAAQHVLLCTVQVIVQLVQPLSQGCRFGIRRHWG